jgi:hypothetical protein
MEINIEKSTTMIYERKETQNCNTRTSIRTSHKLQLPGYNYKKIGKDGRLYNFLRTTFLGKKEVPKEIKTQVYQKVVRLSIVYGSESWTLTKNNKSKIVATKIRFLRRRKGITRRDRVRNETVVSELNA